MPTDVSSPDDVSVVTVRAVGNERIIAPLNSSWDSFFLKSVAVTDDFMVCRVPQAQGGSEGLSDFKLHKQKIQLAVLFKSAGAALDPKVVPLRENRPSPATPIPR